MTKITINYAAPINALGAFFGPWLIFQVMDWKITFGQWSLIAVILFFMYILISFEYKVETTR